MKMLLRVKREAVKPIRTIATRVFFTFVNSFASAFVVVIVVVIWFAHRTQFKAKTFLVFISVIWHAGMHSMIPCSKTCSMCVCQQLCILWQHNKNIIISNIITFHTVAMTVATAMKMTTKRTYRSLFLDKKISQLLQSCSRFILTYRYRVFGLSIHSIYLSSLLISLVYAFSNSPIKCTIARCQCASFVLRESVWVLVYKERMQLLLLLLLLLLSFFFFLFFSWSYSISTMRKSRVHFQNYQTFLCVRVCTHLFLCVHAMNVWVYTERNISFTLQFRINTVAVCESGSKCDVELTPKQKDVMRSIQL